jgi:nanoRNase/pAp phosphatase (c-di-AMP/oligoRNAs hydrolase)
MPEPENKTKAPLLEAIKALDLNKVAIFTGAGVDPDGLASGLAMKAIIEKSGGSALIFYRGTFNRPQNKTVREILGLNVYPYSDFNSSGDWTAIISVDGPGEVCPEQPNIIIDHHKPGKPAPDGNDVRANGSCASILWEYAMEAGLDFSTDDGAILATAICIGISTDTNNFKEEATTKLDSDAYAYCLNNKDYASFLSILNYPKPPYYNDMYCYGWENKLKSETGTVLVSGLGPISEGRSGVISDLAEKYCETDGITTTMVLALVRDEMVGSMRSSNPSHDVNEYMKGFGGGGKRGAGAFRMKLPGIMDNTDEEDRQRIFDAYFAIMAKKTFSFAGDET